jgi:hypothetical protein
MAIFKIYKKNVKMRSIGGNLGYADLIRAQEIKKN